VVDLFLRWQIVNFTIFSPWLQRRKGGREFVFLVCPLYFSLQLHLSYPWSNVIGFSPISRSRGREMRVAKAIAYGMYLRITKVCVIFGSILVSSDIPIYLIFDIQMLFFRTYYRRNLWRSCSWSLPSIQGFFYCNHCHSYLVNKYFV
jgi:hypothetical protein